MAQGGPKLRSNNTDCHDEAASVREHAGRVAPGFRALFDPSQANRQPDRGLHCVNLPAGPRHLSGSMLPSPTHVGRQSPSNQRDLPLLRLMSELKDKNAAVRMRAVKELGNSAVRANAVLPLAEGLRDRQNNDDIRLHIAKALGESAPVPKWISERHRRSPRHK